MKRWAIAIALTALIVSSGSTTPVEADIVLNPGYIQGTITIPGFQVERYTINSIAYDPVDGRYYQAQTFGDENGSYLLTMEGGDLVHEVSYSAKLVPNVSAIKGSNLRWTRRFSPAVGETITHDVTLDGVVAGTLTVPDFDFRSYQIEITAPGATQGDPAYGIKMNLTYDIAATNWSVPVIGGVDDYRVLLTGMGHSSSVPTGQVEGTLWDVDVTEVDVPQNGTATIDWEPAIGRLAGTISASQGAIHRWHLYAATTLSDRTAEGRSVEWYDTHYLQPVVAGTVDARLLVFPEDYPSEWLATQTVAVAAGETVQVDWVWTPPPTGTVAGTITASGINANLVSVSTDYRGTRIDAEGPYEITNILPAQEHVRFSVGREESDDTQSWQTRLDGATPEPVTIVANQTTTVDLPLEGAMLTGSLLSDGAHGEGEVYSHELSFMPALAVSGLLATSKVQTYRYDLSVEDGWGGNAFRAWLPEGSWRPTRVRWRFRIPMADGYCDSIVWAQNGIHQTTWPVATVLRDTEPTYYFDATPARITLRLRVADGSLFSNPYVSGQAVWDEGETRPYISLGASGRVFDAPASTVSEVVLYALPATYVFTGQGLVNGSTTTFGTSRLTVGPGDVVDQDLHGPVIVITAPEGYTELQSSTVTVTGTVTDDSPIASLTINGQTVSDYDPDTGAFSFILTGLVAGDNAFTVAASDLHGNQSSVTRTVTVVNTGPVALIDCEDTVEATSATATSVTLDGTDSYDENGDALTYAWYVDDDLVGTDPVVYPTLGVGDHVVVLEVTDAWGETGEASATISVVDTTPPTATVGGVSPGALWPPDHKLTPVDIELAVHDAVDAAVTCRILDVRSSEPENGDGDGETEPDWVYSGAADDLSLWLRAERSGVGNGRTYTVVVECRDDAGNYTLVEIAVPVAHDKGN